MPERKRRTRRRAAKAVWPREVGGSIRYGEEIRDERLQVCKNISATYVPDSRLKRQQNGVNPFCRTRRKVNFPALIRKPPQTQQEADILSSNAVFWYSTPLR